MLEITTALLSDEFVEQYAPREKPDGSLVYDYHETRQFPMNHIWTLVESGEKDNTYAIPGYHMVNRVGYLVTEKQWTDDNIEVLWIDDTEIERNIL